MRHSFIIIAAIATVAIVGITTNIDAQNNTPAEKKAKHTAAQNARQQQRAERIAAFEKHIDSIVLSQHFRFEPQTMQQLPAGITRNLMNPEYEIQVWGSEVDVCIPYIKGITPPYYPVIFNYVLPYVSGYTTEQTHDGWSITFSSTLYSSNDYTFHLEIYSRYGGALLTISSPFYNSVQYTGNIFGI